MRNVNYKRNSRRQLGIIKALGLTAIFFLFSYGLRAQQSQLIPNQSTPLVNLSGGGPEPGDFNNLTVVSSKVSVFDDFENKSRIIDADATNASSWTYIIGGSAWVEVTDGSATGTQAFPAGSMAGFVVDNSSLNVLGSVTIKTYKGGSFREQSSNSSLLALSLLSSKGEIGFITTMDYDRIRIEYTALGVAGTKSVYYAFVKKFEAGPSLACNVNTVIGAPTYPMVINSARTGVQGLAVGSVLGAESIVDTSASTAATLNITAGVLNGSAAVSLQNVITDYPVGTFVGFDIASSSLLGLGVLANVTLESYLNDTLKQTVSGSDLIANAGLLSGTGRNIVGFVTTTGVDEIRLVLNSGAASVNLGSTSVYGAIFKTFCEGSALPCNLNTVLKSPAYPIIIDKTVSGILGVGLGNSITDVNRIIDADSLNYATINKPLVGALSDTVNLSVKKMLTKFPTNTFAGFDIESVGLLDLGVLDALTVELYDGPTLVQSSSASSLLNIGIPLVSGTGRRTIGVIATAPYNEIRLAVDYGLASVGALSATRVYGAVVQQFCIGDSLVCNMPTNMTKPEFPMYVDGQNTGITGVGAVGAINNWDSAIDNNPNSYATINQAVGLLSTASFTIGDALTTYPAKTFAGIDIQTNSLLSTALLNNYSVVLLKKGIVVQTSTVSDVIVNVGSSLLTGTSRQTIGIVSDTSFDAIKLEIYKPVGVDLGETRIYGAIFEKLCPTVILCSETSVLQIGTHPVIINGVRTGVLGVANVGASVANPERLIDQDTANYTQLSTVANVLSSASISVLNPIQQYPTGTFAGFVVKNNNGLLAANVLNTITINTYLHGTQQESNTGNSLVDLDLLVNLIGVGNDARNIGFVTTKPFDEIQITVGSIASVIATVQVFGAFVDTRTSIGGDLFCLNAMPDLGATYVNMQLNGNVRTNDEMPEGSLYGTPIVNGTNPSASVPVVSDSGTYTFVTSVPGVYNYNVPVCLPNQTTGCKLTALQITVLDTAIGSVNPPVANTDIAMTRGGMAVAIPVKANDGRGNTNGTLGTPTVTNSGSGMPANGSVSVDTAGRVVYTPNPGFYGQDEFMYVICETPSGICDSANVYVTVLDSSARNVTMAADDYNRTKGTITTGNVKTNDIDPDGDIQTVATQNLTSTSGTAATNPVFGKGSFNLDANGVYTFIPKAGFAGTVVIPYTICDDGAPVACARATLYILVEGAPDLTLTSLIQNPNFLTANGTSSNLRLLVSELNGFSTNNSVTTPVYLRITKSSSSFTYSFDPNLTSINVGVSRGVDNLKWDLVQNTASQMLFKLKAGENIAGFGSSSIGITLQVIGTATISTLNITSIILSNSGGESPNTNNDINRIVNIQ